MKWWWWFLLLFFRATKNKENFHKLNILSLSTVTVTVFCFCCCSSSFTCHTRFSVKTKKLAEKIIHQEFTSFFLFSEREKKSVNQFASLMVNTTSTKKRNSVTWIFEIAENSLQEFVEFSFFFVGKIFQNQTTKM